MNETPDSTGDKERNETGDTLTPKQLENWRNLFPQLRFVSDAGVTRFRDAIQRRFNPSVQGSEVPTPQTPSDTRRKP